MNEGTDWSSVFPDLDDDMEIPAILLGAVPPAEVEVMVEPPLVIPTILLPQSERNKRHNQRDAKTLKKAKRRAKSKRTRALKQKSRKR